MSAKTGMEIKTIYLSDEPITFGGFFAVGRHDPIEFAKQASRYLPGAIIDPAAVKEGIRCRECVCVTAVDERLDHAECAAEDMVEEITYWPVEIDP